MWYSFIMSRVLSNNPLNYSIKTDDCATRKRQYVHYNFAERNIRSEGIARVALPTGPAFINGKRCYLAFQLGINDNAHCHFGCCGSAFNVLQSIRIQDRHGNVLERVDDVNLLANSLIRWDCDKCWLDSEGSTFIDPQVKNARGQNGTDADHNPTTSGQPWGYGVGPYVNPISRGLNVTGKTWMLPLHLISGLFAYDQLLPPQLMDGLQIFITAASNNQALVADDARGWAGATLTDRWFELQLLRIHMDLSYLEPSISRQIEEKSRSGLDICITTWDSQYKDIRGEAIIIEFPFMKSVSRGLQAFAKITRNWKNIKDVVARDSFQSKEYRIKNWYWRINNVKYPRQGVGMTGQFANEHTTFILTKQMFNKNSIATKDNVYTYNAIIGNQRPLTWQESEGDGAITVQSNLPQHTVLPCQLGRGITYDAAGMQIDHTNPLTLVIDKEGQLVDPGNIQQEDDDVHITIFLKFMKILKVYPDKVFVVE